MPTPAAVISRLDQAIDANRLALCVLEGRKLVNVAHWGNAWDRHPDLRARDIELFRQRGVAQQERDTKEWKRKPRLAKPKKCPTCGCRTLVEG